jgi:spermidine/putrescine transport system substrate-binding protein
VRGTPVRTTSTGGKQEMKPRFLVRRLALVVLLVMPALCFAGPDEATAPRELTLLNWPDYIDPDVVKEFEQQFNANVKEVYYETDDIRDTMLVQNEGRGYDVVLMNGIQVDTYRLRGWLAPLGEADVPNLRHVDSRWRSAFAGTGEYAVPYFWGTLGIAYRADLVPEKLTSWNQLFRPADSLHGKIVMVKASRDLIGMALKALGHSANSTDSKQLAEAEKLLMTQKPHVQRYHYVSLSEKSALVTGDTLVAMVYSGDALMLQEHHSDIQYVLPREGGNLWVDFFTVLESSNNKKLAFDFINFLNEPKIAARLAEFVHYPTPNKAAEALLPKEFLKDPNVYPSQNALEKSEFDSVLPPRALKKRNSIFARVVN